MDTQHPSMIAWTGFLQRANLHEPAQGSKGKTAGSWSSGRQAGRPKGSGKKTKTEQPLQRGAILAWAEKLTPDEVKIKVEISVNGGK